MTIGEDALRNRKDNGPGDLAWLTDCGKVISVRGKLKRSGPDDGFLLKVLDSAAGLAGNVETEEIQMR